MNRPARLTGVARRWCVGVAAWSVVMASVVVGSPAAGEPAATGTASGPRVGADPAPDLPSWAHGPWRTLTDQASRLRERQAAASELVRRGENAVRMAIIELLRTTERPLPGPTIGVLRAVAELATAPLWLEEPLVELPTNAGDEAAPAVLAALCSVRTRRAFEAILNATANGSDQAASPTQVEARERRRAAAFDALERLTGRSEIASTSAAWEEWFGPLRFAPEAAWTAALAEGLAERADAVSATLNSTVTRLVDSLRRGYLDTPEGQRPARLVSLLGDEMTQVRTLGLELVERDLANARPLGDAVVNAVIPLLRDDEPAVRARAAGVLGRVAPMTAARPVAEALSAEQQPGAAAALLAAAVRWPEAAMTPAVVTWLRVPGPTRQAAEKLANRLLALPETSTEQAKQLRAALAATPS